MTNSRHFFAALVLAVMAMTATPAAAEESFHIFKDILDKYAPAESEPDNGAGASGHGRIPASVESLTRLSRKVEQDHRFKAPATPGEALRQLDTISGRIDRLETDIDRYGQARRELEQSISLLAQQSRRNRMRLSGWAPLLAGNLRLIRARIGGSSDELWLIAAMVILEAQIERLDQRVRQTQSQGLLMARLDRHGDVLNGQRRELAGALQELRDHLQFMRRHAQAKQLG